MKFRNNESLNLGHMAVVYRKESARTEVRADMDQRTAGNNSLVMHRIGGGAIPAAMHRRRVDETEAVSLMVNASGVVRQFGIDPSSLRTESDILLVDEFVAPIGVLALLDGAVDSVTPL